LKWEAIYRGCVYVDGNLEISNFHPYFNQSLDDFSPNDEYHIGDNDLDTSYNFSFLDDIREITGYLLVHGTRIKSLRFKNLKLIRGKTLFKDKHSVFIDSNVRLERLEMSNLKGFFFNIT
jgi:epidermal growth factor receptor